MTRVENQIVVNAGRAAAVDNNHSDIDASLEAAVRANLRSDPRLAAGGIDIMTRSNIVTLTGVVRSNEEKELAGRLAGQTHEVAEVRNRLCGQRELARLDLGSIPAGESPAATGVFAKRSG